MVLAPSELSNEPTVVEHERPLSLRRMLREQLNAYCVHDSDLEAFCLDWFPEVYKQFSRGMIRTEKLNLLLSMQERLEDIVRALEVEQSLCTGPASNAPPNAASQCVPRPQRGQQELEIIIEDNFSELSPDKLAGWMHAIQRLVGQGQQFKVVLRNCRSGSVILTIRGDWRALISLMKEFAAGRLQTLNGYRVLGAHWLYPPAHRSLYAALLQSLRAHQLRGYVATSHLRNGLGLTAWVLLGLIAGALLGHLEPDWARKLQWIVGLFIRLIKMLVAPTVFSTLVVSLAGSFQRRSERLLFKSQMCFLAASAVALVVALFTANLLQPGLGAIEHGGMTFAPPPPRSFYEQLVTVSIVAAMANNSVLQIVFFSVLFAMALSALGERGRPVVQVLQGVAAAMFKVTEYVMSLAPIGVFAAMASTIGSQGPGIILQMCKLVGALYLALLVFAALLLLGVKALTGLQIRRVLAELKQPLLLAFSTTSSELALPKAISAMERLGVPARIVGFVLPAGNTFNLAGSTLYLALASLFIVQATIQHMPPLTQVEMMLTLLILSKGVAPVPRASVVVLASVCATFGLKVEWIAIMLGVDAAMDMARTTVNVLGNCMAAVVVGKWENELPKDAPLLTGVLPAQYST